MTVTVEGELPDEKGRRLLLALQANLQAAEDRPYVIVDLANDDVG